MPNRLIHETSPYLLQHAHNPVNWFPWGEEAFRVAREADKPILLSVGYAACHWCHVMAHESFENPEIAAIINAHFVPVKVDREERPDVDAVYMNAVQVMTGHGGWPLTVFLTPDGVPFYGGTYFPPTARHGLPAFPSLLKNIARVWQSNRQQLLEDGQQVLAQVKSMAHPRPGGEIDTSILETAVERLVRNADPYYGGFGRAPKFPQPLVLDFLLRMARRFRDDRLIDIVGLTLDHMARGGVYDHIGGGFHRYSVDALWLVPHFEKMLYDNALLPRVYLHYWQLTGDEDALRVLHETLTYVLREMQAPQGGFYSSQDADSEGVEGKFYTWSDDEIEAALDPALAHVVKTFYDIHAGGNFEGRSLLHVPVPPEMVAQRLGRSRQELETMLSLARKRLYEKRSHRVRPARDEKIQTSWNGMMIATLAEVGRILNVSPYLRAAERAAYFLLENLIDEQGRLWHTYKDGKRGARGYLDDYGELIDALLRLYEATFDIRWFRQAWNLAQQMIELFWEGGTGLFYDTGHDQDALVVRPRDIFDNAYPSGNAIAADVLLRLSTYTDDDSLAGYAETILQYGTRWMSEFPTGFGHLLSVLDMHLGPVQEIALVGAPEDNRTQALIRAAFAPYRPRKVVAYLDPAHPEWSDLIPLLAAKVPIEGAPAAYVCQNFSCRAPTTDPAILENLL